MIADTILSKQRARILIFACGSVPDVRKVAKLIEAKDFLVVLNDMDAEALRYSVEQLAFLGEKISTVQGNALTSINKIAPHGPFDLILCGGLFDYLSEKQAGFLIGQSCARLVAKNGILFFTNIAERNPFKTMITHFGDWNLIERSEDDLRSMVRSACASSPGEVSIVKDGSGLAYLVEIKRAD